MKKEDVIKDEWLIEKIARRDGQVENAIFFKDEYRKASFEIARLQKMQESYYRSFVDYVIKANSMLYAMNDSKIIEIHKEEGFEKSRFYVEELRRHFFNDDNSLALRKYNCIDISSNDPDFSDIHKINYKFSNGNNVFSLVIPMRDHVDSVIQNVFNERSTLRYVPFSYGTIDVVYYDNRKKKDYFYDNREIFSSHDMNEIRAKLVEFAESDFSELKKKIEEKKEIYHCERFA